ncbi:hypothetical protein ACMFMG_002507 [Clarireedia jacksonii]
MSGSLMCAVCGLVFALCAFAGNPRRDDGEIEGRRGEIGALIIVGLALALALALARARALGLWYDMI